MCYLMFVAILNFSVSLCLALAYTIFMSMDQSYKNFYINSHIFKIVSYGNPVTYLDRVDIFITN